MAPNCSSSYRVFTALLKVITARVIPGLTISKPTGAAAGSGFGENLFSDHRTMHLMKLMASTMLSAAIKRQYSSVLPLLRHCLPVFDEICVTEMNIMYFCRPSE